MIQLEMKTMQKKNDIFKKPSVNYKFFSLCVRWSGKTHRISLGLNSRKRPIIYFDLFKKTNIFHQNIMEILLYTLYSCQGFL